ncbi:prepilin peptidase [Pseudomonas sp. ZM23]|uniref:Prepilin peptidase n=1 Tax=Pseudomonas triclosanedens TaxID=2961893 RepID=A0ABY7A1R1_9PSED|nr:prepilin peptidase [Pseudomonas triclosanedens]MCP8464694.1 prepilin peptidase [Pseudomonas triclosanedens]MCP8473625.1 prepilin peptidase [Pseudomonas triclosanedens]MCP8478462.1 prepilin peptidase [Pseudomonas triclosanedens]WAI50825.1 prepilin peptidase [Pseudomonas triclosanedens]
MLVNFLLLGWFAACAYQDLTRLRVSNLLTLGGALIAGVFLLLEGHTLTGHTPLEASSAVVLALLLSLPGYALGKLGAADVKALLALALASDPQALLYVLALASLFTLALMFASKLLIDSDWLPANFESKLARLLPSTFKSFPFIFSVFVGLLTYMSFIH